MVLFFYPLDFTFVCPTEITAFSDRHAEFAKLNCEVRAQGIQLRTRLTVSAHAALCIGAGCVRGLSLLTPGLVPDR